MQSLHTYYICESLKVKSTCMLGYMFKHSIFIAIYVYILNWQLETDIMSINNNVCQ